jgi:ketosteroid isomerase-like protein
MTADDAEFERFFAERIKVAEHYSSGDPGPLLAIVPTQGALTFHSPQGQTYSGADTVREVFTAQSSAFSAGGESELVVLQQGVGGELAFWTGFQIARVRQGGDAPPREMRIRVTEVFRKIDGAWKLVHRHGDLGAPR